MMWTLQQRQWQQQQQQQQNNVEHNDNQHNIRSLSPPSKILTISRTTEQQSQGIHSWGPEGIDFQNMLHFIRILYNHPESLESHWYDKNYGPFLVILARNGRLVGREVGVFASQEHQQRPPLLRLWISKRILHRRNHGDIVKKRFRKMLVHFQDALSSNRLSVATNIKNALFSWGGSIPLLFQLDDYRGCNYGNYNVTDTKGQKILASIPLFTLCRNTACGYGFPIPTYKAYKNVLDVPNAMVGDKVWSERFANWSSIYPSPWLQKIPKAVWRGGCVGSARDHRRVLTQKANILKNQPHMDVRPVGESCWKALNNITATKMPETDFMNYRAVLDMDGNSWSERFSRLLCYNTVVIRVEVLDANHHAGDYEEHFFFSSLEPNVHYVPADLSNFTRVTARVVKDQFQHDAARIIRNANEWCRRHMNVEQLNQDFLSVLSGYMESLDATSLSWSEYWKQHQDEYIGLNAWEGHGGFTDQVWPLTNIEPSSSVREGLMTRQ